MDRFDAMNVFVTVADARGFAPAARKLKLSPSVVTRQIASLEELIGTRLLQRTTRSVALTDAGTRYLERARLILAEVDQAERAAHADQGAPMGRLTVTAPNLFGRLHVAPFMGAFLSKHPQVVGELSLTDRNASLVEEGVDVAVRIGHLHDSSLVARKLGSTRRVLVASPEYLSTRAKIRIPVDLRDHELIHFTSINQAAEWHFPNRGKDVRVAVVSRFVTNSADAALAHAERGGGITMALGYQVIDAVRAKRLRVVLSDFESPALPIHLVYPTARLLSAKVRAFVDFAAEWSDWDFTRF